MGLGHKSKMTQMRQKGHIVDGNHTSTSAKWQEIEQSLIRVSIDVIFCSQLSVEAQRGKKWLAAKHTDQSVRTMY